MDDLVDQIYEAALVPEKWPGVLDRLSELTGSVGGAVLATGDRHPPRWAASDIVAPSLKAFATSDAWKSNKRPQRWLSASDRGFVRDVDIFTDRELLGEPGFGDLQSKGLGWQLGVVIPMMTGEIVVYSLERRFDDGAHHASASDVANRFRPHLARAGLLAARLGFEQARTAVATLEAIGLAAAVATPSGRIVVTNGLFDSLPLFLPTAHGGVALADASADSVFSTAVTAAAAAERHSSSIPIAATLERPAAVIHVLPLSGAGYDIFSGASTLIIASVLDASARSPDLQLLRGLFDLSPAETKLAAALAAGMALKDAASRQGIQISTARSYVESIFRKTGTRQQSQLVALLKSVQPMLTRR
jgi:DNA-binding CsgD family transcriptional regulator